jgi:STE24 endopeptidase
MTASTRAVAATVTIVGVVGFAVTAWWLVPWNPVPGGSVTPVQASEVFSAAEVARAEDYSRWSLTWSLSSLAVSLAVACWLGFTDAGSRLVARLPGSWWLKVVLAVAACEVIGRLATLPFGAASRQLRLEAGLTTQSWGSWAIDVLLGQGVVIVVTSLVLLVLVGSARRWPRAWPAVAGLALGCFALAASFVYPLVVEPLFNRFTPLPDGSLRTSVLELADREGVAVDDVLVADASRRTTTLNAYVSGFGATRRVVLYDNLVDDTPEDQTLSVVAHELAHARHDDVLVGSALGALGVVAGVGLLGLVMAPRPGGRAGVPDPARTPRVLAWLAVGVLLASPVQSGISRSLETRADVDALRATEDPESFVALQRALALRSRSDPAPPAPVQFWFGSHPTVLERVAVARSEDVSS